MKKPRARDLGIPFDGTPGPLNAITDVASVEVGHTTIVSGEGELQVGVGPVRTGVTAILPRGKQSIAPCFAGWFSLNGNGEMTGTTWVEESGFLESPVMITNTHSVGIVRDSVIAWYVRERQRPGLNTFGEDFWSLPVVGETYDGYLNDINGFHVREEHVFEALSGASAANVEEGSVGGGTGMICYQFKGGIGTASRVLDEEQGGYTLGVLAQCNFGLRRQLLVAGVPVGREIPEELPGPATESTAIGDIGSVIVVVATDAPLLPHQLKRIARRVGMGLARTGSVAGNSSGDIFLAFSTANPEAAEAPTSRVEVLNNNNITPLFEATVQATEEAVINALVAADTMIGRDNHRVIGLPHARLQEVLRKYNRLGKGANSV
ncbi:MAG: D-aminopeptidase [Chloroflexia bacterium]|jgi:L-aminopeptidase/D-esterase-like protein|nr:D-aminopeptidase [Chloroflexia bacterium]